MAPRDAHPRALGQPVLAGDDRTVACNQRPHRALGDFEAPRDCERPEPCDAVQRRPRHGPTADVAEIDAAEGSDDIALDISAVTAAFGWRPRVGIREGLARLAEQETDPDWDWPIIGLLLDDGDSVGFVQINRPENLYRRDWRRTVLQKEFPRLISESRPQRVGLVLNTTSDTGGGLCRAELHHGPWPLQRAEAELELTSIAPFTLRGEPVCHFAARQDTLVWPLERVSVAR